MLKFKQTDRNCKPKFYGYSAIELMLVLSLVGLIVYFSLQYSTTLLSLSKAENTAQQAANYSQAVIRYMHTHQNLLRNLLSRGGNSNGLVATVSTQVLKNEGFIKNDLYFQNNLKQYPCTVIYYQNKQLQSFIYYRTNGNDIKLDRRQLNDGLNHIGAMLGLYTNGNLVGHARDWQVKSGMTADKFIWQGTADISRGKNPALYACSGQKVANNSYVVNVTSMLMLNNRLPNDDTIHQYQDPLHDENDPQSNNMMNTDLVMDYTDEKNKNTKSNVIFQMNPDCVMDPQRPETLQDYDPDNESNLSIANIYGCKNRQLAIAETKDENGRPGMIVTGFQRGGYMQAGENSNDMRPYVGEIRAASLQPMVEVGVGTACDGSEIGKMARQQESADPYSVNNIYLSQVICMKSPLCQATTAGFCYLPLQNVTIESHPDRASHTCPKGTFIDIAKLEEEEPSKPGDVRCTFQWCSYIDKQFDHGGSSPFRFSGRLTNGYPPLFEKVELDYSTWKLWCGRPVQGGCNVNERQWHRQGKITRIDCTNDPGKASIEILQN